MAFSADKGVCLRLHHSRISGSYPTPLLPPCLVHVLKDRKLRRNVLIFMPLLHVPMDYAAVTSVFLLILQTLFSSSFNEAKGFKESSPDEGISCSNPNPLLLLPVSLSHVLKDRKLRQNILIFMLLLHVRSAFM